jgi:hypothetical protein
MDGQARTGDTVLVKTNSREMMGGTGRQTLAWWRGKDDRKQNKFAPLVQRVPYEINFHLGACTVYDRLKNWQVSHNLHAQR